MKIKTQVLNVTSNVDAPWACRIYGTETVAPNLWFFYRTRKIARIKLKELKTNFNLAWFKAVMG